MMRLSGWLRTGHPVLMLFALLFLIAAASPLTAAEDEHGGGLTVIPDASVIIQIINFLFLVWALNVIVYRPIRNVLAQRRDKFSELQQGIELADRDAAERQAAIAANISEARAEGLHAKEAILQEATDEERRIIQDINQKAQQHMVEVRRQIESEMEDVRASLEKEVDGFADSITGKILGRAA